MSVSAPDQHWSPACDKTLLQSVLQALGRLPTDVGLGVALSAGADSAMLAVHLARAAGQTGHAVHCFHVHHGLQGPADAWLEQARHLSALLGLPFHSKRVQVHMTGKGVEAAARDARYQALAGLADSTGIEHLFLAHHQDDQAETVLLRLVRGAGPLGLSAMDFASTRAGKTWHRPWLDQPRSRILACAGTFGDITGWHPVQDPTNIDTRYARGVVRAELAGTLDAHWPAWRQVLARHAQQARELAAWARQASEDDLRQLDPDADGAGFALLAWRTLPPARQAMVLRHWLHTQGLRMPTHARLQDWLRQLRGVHALGHDRNVRLHHESCFITVRRGRVRLERNASDHSGPQMDAAQ